MENIEVHQREEGWVPGGEIEILCVYVLYWAKFYNRNEWEKLNNVKEI